MAGVAVKIIVSPIRYVKDPDVHVGPQLMPVVAPSALVTVPVPPLAADFESVAMAEGGLKVAIRLTGAVIVTSQTEEVPAQLPDQPPKTEPAPQSATSWTGVPYLMVSEHTLAGQSMPPPETPPVPRPDTVTDRTCGASNVAVTLFAAFIVTVQSPTTPEQDRKSTRLNSSHRT